MTTLDRSQMIPSLEFAKLQEEIQKIATPIGGRVYRGFARELKRDQIKKRIKDKIQEWRGDTANG